jgi:transcriptional regulator with XRE-family HTH domain
MPPYLNDVEHDRRHPPENTVIEQLAQVLNVSPDFLYFYARRLPANVESDFDEGSIEAAYRAFRKELQQARTTDPGRRPTPITRTQALARKARDGAFITIAARRGQIGIRHSARTNRAPSSRPLPERRAGRT